MKKTMVCQSEAQQKKGGGESGWALCPCSWACQDCCRLPGMEPESSHPSLTNDCAGMVYFGDIFGPICFPKGPNPIFSVVRHAVACFKNPTNRPPKQVPRHASTVGACTTPHHTTPHHTTPHHTTPRHATPHHTTPHHTTPHHTTPHHTTPHHTTPHHTTISMRPQCAPAQGPGVQ